VNGADRYAEGTETVNDDATPAWAATLIETMNAGFAEVRASSDQVTRHLGRLELATDRMTAAVDELEVQLAAVETRMGLRDGPQT
jgi:hypothetical protein